MENPIIDIQKETLPTSPITVNPAQRRDGTVNPAQRRDSFSPINLNTASNQVRKQVHNLLAATNELLWSINTPTKPNQNTNRADLKDAAAHHRKMLDSAQKGMDLLRIIRSPSPRATPNTTSTWGSSMSSEFSFPSDTKHAQTTAETPAALTRYRGNLMEDFNEAANDKRDILDQVQQQRLTMFIDRRTPARQKNLSKRTPAPQPTERFHDAFARGALSARKKPAPQPTKRFLDALDRGALSAREKTHNTM